MKRMIFIFIDGIGIGTPTPTNPFFVAKTDYLPLYQSGLTLPDGTPIKPIDACLGTEGMPMSATGQTTLFSGTNIPALLNEHRDSYPDTFMRKIIKKNNLFSLLKQHKFHPCFLNAFPGNTDLFSPEHIHIQENGELYTSLTFQRLIKRSLSVTTCMMIASHSKPFGTLHIQKEESLFHDFTNLSLISKTFPLTPFSPEKAAEIMYHTSQKYDLLLYEYFQTDFYGHGFELSDCIDLIQQLNRLLKHLFSLLDKEQDTLLITSDHGNLEDLTTPLHTYNPVPLITWGKHGEILRENIHNLSHVTPAILQTFLNSSPSPSRLPQTNTPKFQNPAL